MSWSACCLNPLLDYQFCLRFCQISLSFHSSLVLKWITTSRHFWLRNSIGFYIEISSSFLLTYQSSIFLHSSTLLKGLAFSSESSALWSLHCHLSHCLKQSYSWSCRRQFDNLQSHSSYFVNPGWYSKAPFCCQFIIILVKSLHLSWRMGSLLLVSQYSGHRLSSRLLSISCFSNVIFY